MQASLAMELFDELGAFAIGSIWSLMKLREQKAVGEHHAADEAEARCRRSREEFQEDEAG